MQERAAVDLVLAIVADVVAEGFQDAGGLFIDRKEAFFILGKDGREHFFRRHATFVHEVAHAHHPAENWRAGIDDVHDSQERIHKRQELILAAGVEQNVSLFWQVQILRPLGIFPGADGEGIVVL